MNYHTTLFFQTLSFIPRHVFQKLERRHKTGRASRRFGFKEQFTVMALPSLMRFKNTLRAMREGRYKDAADGMAASAWYHQVKGRARELVEQMLTGKWPDK